jgi:ketosteroid isomerase-like protein
LNASPSLILGAGRTAKCRFLVYSKSIALSEPSVAVVGNNAIARHIFSAETESDGKAASARVGVLQVWQKQDARWKLLARQAFRLPA